MQQFHLVDLGAIPKDFFRDLTVPGNTKKTTVQTEV